MDELRQGLEQIVNAIEEISNRPTAKPAFITNELSGDIIHGGTVTRFNSTGIADEATRRVILVKDDGLYTDKLSVTTITSNTTFESDVHVQGELFVTKLHVNELNADVRNERSSPLEFIADTNGIYGKGLIWKGPDISSKQLIYKPNPDRIFSTDTIDLDRSAAYSIGNAVVLTSNTLGPSIQSSSLTRVGTLNNLTTSGNLTIDEFIIYNSDSQRIGFGTESPNASISVTSLETEFVIDVEGPRTKIGNWTTDDLEIITDNTPRITVSSIGHVSIGQKGNTNARLNVFGKLGVGVNNVADDVDVSVSNVLEINGTKIMTGNAMPDSGTFCQGDIVYNTNAVATGYVGWVCVREGTPGEWKPFGQIAS